MGRLSFLGRASALASLLGSGLFRTHLVVYLSAFVVRFCPMLVGFVSFNLATDLFFDAGIATSNARIVPGALGSLLRGGGRGKEAKARKAEETKLLDGLRSLIANFCAPAPDKASANPRGERKTGNGKKAEHVGGLLGALKQITARAKPSNHDQLIPKLKRVVSAAEQGTLSKGRGQPTSITDRNKWSDDIGKGKGNSSSPSAVAPTFSPAYVPTNLSSTHWHGLCTAPDKAAVALAKAVSGDHLVIGPLATWSDSACDIPRPDGVTVTYVCLTPGDSGAGDSSQCFRAVRAPVLDKRAVPKVINVHTLQKGPTRDFLKWGATIGHALPDEQPTAVLRLQLFKANLPNEQWQTISKNVIVGAKLWLKTLRIDQAHIVDVFAPKRLDGNLGVFVNVRVHEVVAPLIDAASGVGGWLARTLPADPADPPPPPGSVEWLEMDEGESGPTFICRARKLAEADKPCVGLAFSVSGSLGLRKPPGTCTAAFIADGFPEHTTFASCDRWLKDNAWTDITFVKRLSHKRNGERVASFRYRGRHPKGCNDVWCVEAPRSNGEPAFIEVSPWRPNVKPKQAVAIRQRGLDADREPKTKTSPPTASVPTTDIANRAPVPIIVDDDSQADPMVKRKREEGVAEPPKDEFLRRLGLIVNPVPMDGACLYHSIAKLFAQRPNSSKLPSTAGAVRTLVVAHMRSLDKLEPFSDRQNCRGGPCESWAAYLKEAVGQGISRLWLLPTYGTFE